MAVELKANSKHKHVYAILRYDQWESMLCPIEFRVTVKKVVVDRLFAEAEVERLNELNKDKGAYYFCQVTRFEDAPVEVQAVSERQSTTPEESRT